MSDWLTTIERCRNPNCPEGGYCGKTCVALLNHDKEWDWFPSMGEMLKTYSREMEEFRKEHPDE